MNSEKPLTQGQGLSKSGGDSLLSLRATSSWLGVAPWQLPEIREALSDCPPGLIEWMIRSRPGSTGRGGGRQWWNENTGRWARSKPSAA